MGMGLSSLKFTKDACSVCALVCGTTGQGNPMSLILIAIVRAYGTSY